MDNYKVSSLFPVFLIQSPYPELYLLPVEGHDSSLGSRSLSPETAFYNSDSQTCYPPTAVFSPGQTKEPTKFPLIKQGPQPSVFDHSLEDESSFTFLEEREEEESGGCEDPIWTETHNMCRSVQEELGGKQDGEKATFCCK